jgi:LSD1 subclass zinc finger protein
MPIQVTCPTCGKLLQAPDSTAGKRVRCPSCQNVIDVPGGALEAEAFTPAGGGYSEPPAFGAAEPDRGPAQAEAGDERRPCPMCGEMIPARAGKCRFCGEVFDPTLRRLETKQKTASSADTDLGVAEWLLAILCSGIGCIFGIVWMIQGKPKGAKMLGISVLFIVIWNVIRFAILAGQH